MNADLQAEVVDAIRQLQGETAETVRLGGQDYPCTASDMVRGSLEYMQGGALDIQNVSVCVLQADLLVQPAINTIAVFRGLNLRVKSVDDAETFWQLLLVQEFA